MDGLDAIIQAVVQEAHVDRILGSTSYAAHTGQASGAQIYGSTAVAINMGGAESVSGEEESLGYNVEQVEIGDDPVLLHSLEEVVDASLNAAASNFALGRAVEVLPAFAPDPRDAADALVFLDDFPALMAEWILAEHGSEVALVASEGNAYCITRESLAVAARAVQGALFTQVETVAGGRATRESFGRAWNGRVVARAGLYGQYQCEGDPRHTFWSPPTDPVVCTIVFSERHYRPRARRIN